MINDQIWLWYETNNAGLHKIEKYTSSHKPEDSVRMTLEALANKN
jgi:hypothetical protein